MTRHSTRLPHLAAALAMALAIGVTAQADYVYYTSRDTSVGGRIIRADTSTGATEVIISGGAINRDGAGQFGGIALDVARGHLYSLDSQHLFRTGLDGSNRTNLVALAPHDYVRDVELDLLHGKVYWAFLFGIWRANLDGSAPEQVVFEGPSSPQSNLGLALDPANNRLYWANYASAPGIYSATLDGGSPARVWNLAGMSPNELEIDLTTQQLYFTDGVTDTVRRARTDGTGAAEVLLQHLAISFPLALDTMHQQVYFEGAAAGSPMSFERIGMNGSGLTSVFPADPFLTDWMEVAVPEPATISLLVLAPLVFRRRRRA